MPFKKGQSGNPKGQPKGCNIPGRPSDRFKELCRRALEDSKGLERMADLAAGKEFPQLATSEGEVLLLPPPIREWRAAIEWLADRGYGKPEQSVEVNDGAERRPSAEELTVALEILRRNDSSRVGVDQKQ